MADCPSVLLADVLIRGNIPQVKEIKDAVGVDADGPTSWRRIGVVADWILQDAYRWWGHCFGISFLNGAALGSFLRTSGLIDDSIIGIFDGDVRRVDTNGGRALGSRIGLGSRAFVLKGCRIGGSSGLFVFAV